MPGNKKRKITVVLKKPLSRKGRTDRRQSKEINTLKKKVKQLQAPVEMKNHDFGFTDVIKFPTSTTGGLIYCLNDVDIWDPNEINQALRNEKSLETRQGMSICCKTLQMRGRISIAPLSKSASTNMARIRMLIVRMPQQGWSGSVLKAADILDGDVNAGAIYVDSLRKLYPAYKYQILYDKRITLQAPYQFPISANIDQYGVPIYKPTHEVNIKLPLNLLKTTWTEETLPVNGEPAMNGLYALFISDGLDTDIQANQPTVAINCRLKFLDN